MRDPESPSSRRGQSPSRRVEPGPPAGFHCPACFYDLSHSPNWTCSECGHRSVPHDVAVAHRLATLREQSSELIAAYGLAILVMAFIELTVTVGVGTVLVLLTWGLGALAPLGLPASRRRVVVTLWTTHCVLLHLPFLMGAGLAWFATLLLAISRSVTDIEHDHSTQILVMTIDVLAWIVAAWVALRVSLAGFRAWRRAWTETMDDSFSRISRRASLQWVEATAVTLNVVGGFAAAGLSAFIMFAPLLG
ncbi:MAG: hypothetical protein ACF8PN_03245 [Phycisphaerales bacterium]